MRTLGILTAAIVFLGLFGLFFAMREGHLAAPKAIKLIQCPAGSKSKDSDVFKLDGTTLAIACQHYGTGKLMANRWKNEEEKDPTHRFYDAFKAFSYNFRKRTDGQFDCAPEASDLIPRTSDNTRYMVGATISMASPRPLNADYFGRPWDMSIPTPQGFAATGPETTFWCHGPKQHYQYQNECIARAQSKGLFWTVRVIFGKPNEDGIDMRPELIEAYQLLAAHIARQD